MSAFHNELNTLPREFIRKYTPKGAYQELLSLGSVSGNTILVSQEVLSLWSVQEILPDPLNLNLPEPPLRRDVLLSCIPISSLDARELSCFSCGLFGSDSECPFCDIRNGTCVQRDILKTRGCFDASWGDTSPSDRDTGQLAGDTVDTVDRGQLAGDTLKTRAAALLHSSSVVLGHRRTGGYKWYESAKPDGLAGDVNMRGKKQVKIFREC